MAQADPQNTARDVLMKRHFALGEEDEHQLRQLACVVSGLKSLAHDGRADTAREPVEIAREDMAAIFDLIAERIEALTADMLFVATH